MLYLCPHEFDKCRQAISLYYLCAYNLIVIGNVIFWKIYIKASMALHVFLQIVFWQRPIPIIRFKSFYCFSYNHYKFRLKPTHIFKPLMRFYHFYIEMQKRLLWKFFHKRSNHANSIKSSISTNTSNSKWN